MRTKLLITAILSLIAFFQLLCQSFEWVNHYASNHNVDGLESAADPDGNIFNVGTFIVETNFNANNNGTSIEPAFTNNLYITKTSSDGSLLWVKQIFCGIHTHKPIAVDSQGNLYITGHFNGTVDFDPGDGVYHLTSHHIHADAFILKLNNDGEFIWAKHIGNDHSTYPKDIDVDLQGNVYLTGNFNGTIDLDPGENSYTQSSPHSTGTFILKLNTDGSFLWGRSFKGYSNTLSASIKVDNQGNVYTAGTFQGNVDFNPSPQVYFLNQPHNRGSYISKLNTYGNFVWAKHFVSHFAGNAPHHLAIDSNQNVIVAGYSIGATDFDTGEGEYILGEGNTVNYSYVAHLDTEGQFNWARMFAGFAYGVDYDSDNNVYAAGYFMGPLILEEEGIILNNHGHSNTDIYVIKFLSSGTAEWGYNFGGIDVERAMDVSIDRNRNSLYLTGLFLSETDFDLSEESEYILYPAVPVFSDAFLLKLNIKDDLSQTDLPKTEFTLFPNPVNDKIRLKAAGTWKNVKLYDSLGREIKTLNLTGKTLSVSGLSKGIYFIRFELDNQSYTQKLIVK